MKHIPSNLHSLLKDKTVLLSIREDTIEDFTWQYEPVPEFTVKVKGEWYIIPLSEKIKEGIGKVYRPLVECIFHVIDGKMELGLSEAVVTQSN